MGGNSSETGLTSNLVFNQSTAAATLNQMRLFQVLASKMKYRYHRFRKGYVPIINFQAGLNPLWNPSLSSLYYNSDHLLQLQHRIGLGLGNDATALQQLLFQSFQQQQLQQQAKGNYKYSF